MVETPLKHDLDIEEDNSILVTMKIIENTDLKKLFQ